MLKPMSEVTRILSAVEQGDPHAAEQLLPLVYEELRKLAAARMKKNKDLDLLRESEDFKKLVAELEAKQATTKKP